MDEPIIYRFRSLEKNKLNREVDSIKEHSLWFSLPESLNDCQEFLIDICVDLTPLSEENLNALTKQINDRTVSMVTEDKLSDISKMGLLTETVKSYISELTKHILTCSFSRNKARNRRKKPLRNAMMWGHYANALEGLVLGFNEANLLSDIKRSHPTCEKGDIIYRPSEGPIPKINYADSLKGGAEKPNLERVFEDWLCTKSNDWDYEEEVRFIIPPPIEHNSSGSGSGSDSASPHLNQCNKVHYTPEALQEIIFGSKLKLDLLLDLHKSLPMHVKFFYACRSDTHYAIEVKPIDRNSLNLGTTNAS